MVEQAELTLTFDLRTIEHLGIQMYKTLPPVLSEMISNAYDADATIVDISKVLYDKYNKCMLDKQEFNLNLEYKTVKEKLLKYEICFKDIERRMELYYADEPYLITPPLGYTMRELKYEDFDAILSFANKKKSSDFDRFVENLKRELLLERVEQFVLIQNMQGFQTHVGHAHKTCIISAAG